MENNQIYTLNYDKILITIITSYFIDILLILYF